MPLRVTFDTNTLADVVLPEASQQPTNPADAARVRAAIQLGKIQGFFSETLVTLEGVQTKDRAAVFGSTRLQSESTCTDENTITISIGVVQDRKPLEPRFFERIQAARGLGMQRPCPYRVDLRSGRRRYAFRAGWVNAGAFSAFGQGP
jgi:hypothetical protein